MYCTVDCTVLYTHTHTYKVIEIQVKIKYKYVKTCNYYTINDRMYNKGMITRKIIIILCIQYTNNLVGTI